MTDAESSEARDKAPSDEWIAAINRRLRARDVPIAGRPLRAIAEWSEETGDAVGVLSSPAARRIWDWYERHYEEQMKGTPFCRGAYLFDGEFWPVELGIPYGESEVSPLGSLETMPDSVKRDFSSSPTLLRGYIDTWADAVDYGLGRDDIQKLNALTSEARDMFFAADNELGAAVALLLDSRPHPDAVFRCRSAIEKFAKAVLVEEEGISDRQLRTEIGHDLEKALRRAGSYIPELLSLIPLTGAFPDHTDSYRGVTERSIDELFQFYRVSQEVAAAVTRNYTDRDLRDSIRIG